MLNVSDPIQRLDFIIYGCRLFFSDDFAGITSALEQ